MKIVIDISNYDVEWINNAHYIPSEISSKIADAIITGTPLLEGHGRLIDAEDVKNNHEKWLGYLDEDMIARLNIAIDNHVKTIIEADKEAER